MNKLCKPSFLVMVFSFISTLVLAPVIFSAPGDVLSVAAPLLNSEVPNVRDIQDGDSSVSTQTGAFIYNFPITVPPGRLGNQPNLSLNYSSQAAIYGGIASGWTLPIPMIRRDTSEGILQGVTVYSSSLSGGQRLQPAIPDYVSIKFTDLPAGQNGVYMAEHDGNYIRYERFGGKPWLWLARGLDGTTYYFGDEGHLVESDGTPWSYGRAPLTRTVDPFGNTVNYFWDGDLNIQHTTYSSNSDAGLDAHAAVYFDYAVVQLCPNNELPVGASASYRSGEAEFSGTRMLTKIRTRVRMENTDEWRDVRTIELGYDTEAESCDAAHAPVRLLTSIQESAVSPLGKPVNTPPVTFDYGPLTPIFNGELSFTFHASNGPLGGKSLSWGKRHGDIWPSVESMLLDMDGDGRQDRLNANYNTVTGTCEAVWHRNTGFSFELIGRPAELPMLPWKDGQRKTLEEERCALNFQRTLRTNTSPDPQQNCISPSGTYLAYRYLDMNADGLPDLVSAMHYDQAFYHPDEDEDWVGPYSFPKSRGLGNGGGGRLATSGSTTTSSLITASAAPGDDRGGGVNCDNFEHPPLKAYKPRGDYVWDIHWNKGNGVFATAPDWRFSPVPLESENGDSSLGSARGGYSTSLTTIIDIDGDGYLDAVTRKGNADKKLDFSDPDEWYVYKGDGTGGFPPRSVFKNGEINPYRFSVPFGAVMSHGVVGQGFASIDSYSGLMDVNGDGLPDLVQRDSATNVEVFINNGRGFESVAISLSFPYVTHSKISGIDDGIFLRTGTRESHIRPVDYDADGRLDWFTTCHTDTTCSNGPINPQFRFGAGDGHHLLPVSLPFARITYWSLIQSTEAQPDEWFSYADMIDLDGNGTTDLVNTTALPNTLLTQLDDGMPMRLMHTVVNGAGGTMHVRYGAATDPAVIPDGNRVMPNHTWVVKSLTLEDAHGTPDAATLYTYHDPVWDADPRGHYGFRGFERVDTLSPSNALTVETYGYDVDWSGRKTGTDIYANAADDDHPHSLATTTWQAFSLFDGKVTTFHPVLQNNRTCSNGQSYDDCASNGVQLSETSTWTGIRTDEFPDGAAALYAQTGFRQSTASTPVPGDKEQLTTYRLVADWTIYRLLTTKEIGYVLKADKNASKVKSVMIAKSKNIYDASYRVLVKSHVWQNKGTRATTVNTYDMATGLLLSTQSPQQVADDSLAKTTLAYDGLKVHLRRITNAGGHLSYSYTDLGTGVNERMLGPNSASCGTGCATWEGTQTVIDGFGRPLQEKVSVDDSNGGYVGKIRATYVYRDDLSPQRAISRTRTRFGSIVNNDTEIIITKEYDGFGRLMRDSTRVPDMGDAVKTYTYDNASNLVKFTTPDPRTDDGSVVDFIYKYDSLGRNTKITPPDASRIEVVYNGLARTRTSTVAKKFTGLRAPEASVIYTNDVFGHLIEVREQGEATAAAVTLYTYDGNDNLATIVNADNVLTMMTHDFTGNRIKIKRADRKWRYAYDLNNNLLAVTTPVPADGAVADYTTNTEYDELDRVVTRTPASRGMGATRQSKLGIGAITYTYDEVTGTQGNHIGRLSRVTLPFGAVTFQYEARGLMSREQRDFSVDYMASANDSQWIETDYNALNLPTEMRYDDGSKARTIYDLRGLPATVEWYDPGTASWKQVANNDRSLAGQIRTRNSDFSQTREYDYDDMGRPRNDEVLAGSTNTSQVKRTYSYDSVGNLVTVNGFNAGVSGSVLADASYSYDALQRLLNAAGPVGYTGEFSYSKAGNVNSADVDWTDSSHTRDVTYSYGNIDPQAVDKLTDLAAGKTWVYAYDLAGNMTSRNTPNENTTFSWDGEDQLREAVGSFGKEAYYFDHNGQRMLAIDSESGVRFWFGGSETHYSPTGSQNIRWLHIDGARIENGTDIELQYADALQNLMLSLDESGSPVASFLYGPFGEVLQSEGAEEHRRQFNGKENDETTGLRYYGFRSYDPVTLRWVSADPLYRFVPDLGLKEPQNMNLYTFSLNNPLTYYDPDGRKPKDGSKGPEADGSDSNNKCQAGNEAGKCGGKGTAGKTIKDKKAGQRVAAALDRAKTLAQAHHNSGVQKRFNARQAASQLTAVGVSKEQADKLVAGWQGDTSFSVNLEGLKNKQDRLQAGLSNPTIGPNPGNLKTFVTLKMLREELDALTKNGPIGAIAGKTAQKISADVFDASEDTQRRVLIGVSNMAGAMMNMRGERHTPAIQAQTPGIAGSLSQ